MYPINQYFQNLSTIVGALVTARGGRDGQDSPAFPACDQASYRGWKLRLVLTSLLALAHTGAHAALIPPDNTLTIERIIETAADIPDAGERLFLHETNFGEGTIVGMRVGLTLSGTDGQMASGDWYAGLGYDHGGYAVLLNRSGKTSVNPFGYSGDGIDVLFADDTSNDIHLHGGDQGAALTGAWAPSGRHVLPEDVVDTSPRTAFLSSFETRSATGLWQLLLSHEVSGAPATLDSWSLQVDITPAGTQAIQLVSGDRVSTNANSSITIQSAVSTSGNVTFAPEGEIDIQGGLDGSGTVVKEGTGLLVLSDEGSFSGTVEVTDGELRVTNTTGSATGTADVNVTDQGILSGTGHIGGPVSIHSGGTVSPGASPGTLTVDTADWGEGGFYDWEINNANGVAGEAVGWDLFEVLGTLSITASAEDPFTIRVISLTAGNIPGLLVDFDPYATYEWLIASTVTLGDLLVSVELDITQFANASSIPAGGGFSLSANGGDVYLVYVPEPGVCALFTGMLAVVVVALRKRR